MNYGQRKSSRKMKRLMHWYGNKQHPKKVRGKFKRQLCAIRVHIVTDKEIILSTSFAMYRIPRIALTLGGMFEKSKSRSNSECCGNIPFVLFKYNYYVFMGRFGRIRIFRKFRTIQNSR